MHLTGSSSLENIVAEVDVYQSFVFLIELDMFGVIRLFVSIKWTEAY